MARIYDLTDDDSIRGTVLTGGSGRLLSSSVLATDPPASYLFDYEDPQYALRNKKKGVTMVRGPKIEDLKPSSKHQALAVVTDVRLLFLVGTETGDEVRAISLDEIVTVRTDSEGMLQTKIQMETVDDERWTFFVRGDASEAVEYIDHGAQTWTNASRLVDEARDRIDASRQSLENREFDEAREVLEDVADRLETARERVDAMGNGARAALDERATELRERLAQLRREIAAVKGADHHARAQTIWKDKHDFETAARHYDAAIAEYERAQDADGVEPNDAALATRAAGAVREREVLKAAPMADAKAAREVALAAEDPETAAEEWRAALTCYREAVALDWGESDREFEVRRDLARERAAEATDKAIDAHEESGEEWLVAADRIAKGGSHREARQAYKRARDHFAKARDIADRLRQGRFRHLTERIETIDDRLAGKVVPSVTPEKETLSVDAARDILNERVDDSAVPEDQKGSTESPAESRHESEPVAEKGERADGKETTATSASKTEATTAGTTGEEAEGQKSEREAEDDESEVPAAGSPEPATDASLPPEDRETVVVGEGSSTAESGEAEGADSAGRGGDGERPTAVSTGVDNEGTGENESAPADGEDGEFADEAHQDAVGNEEAPTEQESDFPVGTDAEPIDWLRSLSETEFTEFVADLFEAEGWTTTVFASSTSAVYDIVAMRDGDRQLIWTVHRPDGGALGSTVVRRCATARDRTQGTDHGTLVTNGTLSVAAESRADEFAIDVVAADELTERAVDAGLMD